MEHKSHRTGRQKIRRLLGIFMVLVFPASFYWFSPYLSVMGAREGVMTGSMLLFGLLFLSSLVAGRSFCAWVCPAGALMDMVSSAGDKPVARRRIHVIKYLVWAPWLVTILLLWLRAGSPLRLDALYATDAGFSVTSLPALITYLMVVLVFYLLSVLAGRRVPCHTICWMAPFMIPGRSLSTALGLPALRLRVDKSRCTGCLGCEKGCPMSLPVHQLVQARKPDHVDCILCGRCADQCPGSCIRLAWSSPQMPRQPGEGPSMNQIDTGRG